tara:strand:+ start:952 stop:1110 length:159 start_codon:yes stop_codon:yes gene_type:complete
MELSFKMSPPGRVLTWATISLSVAPDEDPFFASSHVMLSITRFVAVGTAADF